jgi:hypothetical protein
VFVGAIAPDRCENYVFDPGRGGERIDQKEFLVEDSLSIQRAPIHFGEVNTYFHIDRIASYVDSLLAELGKPPIPPVLAITHAHGGVMEVDGSVDGMARSGRMRPMQGGHYRLPAVRYDNLEPFPIVANGEIHLGPGYSLLSHGVLSKYHGTKYRHNASHNAGIIYHEYGHHLNRHTADYQGNRFRDGGRQTNRKSAIDEGTSDYWAATVLGDPHIWVLSRKTSESRLHPRDLRSSKTVQEIDRAIVGDPHEAGTIWAAALWDFRSSCPLAEQEVANTADRIVLQAMLLLGENRSLISHKRNHDFVDSFSQGLTAMLQADEQISGGKFSEEIVSAFSRRGISS